ncbi:MAG TPA: cytochrome c3 family protein [Bryobacterales bacterium]|nr:cytochrome c3 family protein [Bryobacterales bacterium]
MNRLAGLTTLWLALGLAGWIAAPAGRAQTAEKPACSSCHQQAEKIQNTVHASVGCATCHPRHEQFPHPAGIPKPACATCHADIARDYARGVHGRAAREGNSAAPNCSVCHGDPHEVKDPGSSAFRKAVPDTCGMCHSDIAQQYKASVHGQALERGVSAAPLCADCHGEHSIEGPRPESSPVNSRHIRETCARCHGDIRLSRRFNLPADRVVSFDASFHGMAAKTGALAVANCASCHGVHNILPSSDPRSTIHPKNLPATCGQCHPGAGRRFALGPVHELPGRVEPAAVRWVRAIYVVLIPSLLGLLFLHNFGDWIRKLGRPRGAAPPGQAPELRMFRFERIEHALLILSFAALAWTGFALKYPDPWWARPLTGWGASWELRGTLHRIAAAIFVAVAVMHLISLAANPRLRQHWRSLWPRRRDAGEAFRNFGYNLGVRSQPPPLSAHSYAEKFEYWALAWGAVIMTLTGVPLWAHDFSLRWLPKVAIDLATAVHFYEAVLATLAIAVWHFYFVIFDPDVYPMDTAWLTGFSTRKRPPSDPGDPPS